MTSGARGTRVLGHGRLRRLVFGSRPRRNSDRGGPILEFAAVLPVLLLTVVVSIEAFLAFVAIERIESAARAGARVAGSEQLEGAERAARTALPSWLENADVTSGANDSDGYYVEVSHPMPIVFSSVDLNLTLTRRVDMPNV
ncbi:pilus assembly protein [Nocardiopsis exhalans]|uniref:Pilus assembly protein n=1 Tax=Nocardiopsis exhalans TaxID=163604 RepID=A0ABY5DFK8_9ACTN|nr:TadE/TadG family type IV pilus assembly protein [Nocardiopsis exhalans]USY21853.1 pilus assembly protein [Nocardiopsis exhalans]